MPDATRQLHFTHALERFYARLDELLASARLHSASLPPELLDEIAYVTGELTIVLTNHDGHQEEEPIKEVLALAQTLRRHLRSNQLKGEQIVQAFNPFREKIDKLLGGHQKAA
jgi:ABC-type Mn2+/Zn2+ transport system ATPase subunit